jgi:hypothetical protein
VSPDDQELGVARFERTCKGGMVGCAVMVLALAIVLVLAPFVTTWLRMWGCHASREMPTAVALFVILCCGPACLILGAVGARCRRSVAAVGYGTILLTAIAAVLLACAGLPFDPVAWGEILGLIIAAGALCALSAGNGALVGRSVPNPGEKKRSPWPSWRESCAALALLAIVLAYFAYCLTAFHH